MHKLSSPGFSLLDSPDSDDKPNSGGLKFFTSRSRTAVTVKINNTVKLSAINGEITIHPKEGGFEKKNVGRSIEMELEKNIAAASLNSPIYKTRLEDAHPLSSVASRSSPPKPTRFPGSPSPMKPSFRSTPNRTPTRISPRKKLLKNIYSPSVLKTPRNSPCLTNKNEFEGNDVAKRSSNIIKHSTPVSKSNFSEIQTGEDTDLEDLELAFDKVESDSKEDDILKFLLKDNPSLEKISSPLRRSPRKHQNYIKKTPKGKAELTSDAESPEKNEKMKYFKIFEPKKQQLSLPFDTNQNHKTTHCQLKKFLTKKSDKSQLIIDAGQREYGAKFCKVCGILYEVGDPEDEENHRKFHHSVPFTLKFNGWKNERQVTNIDDLGGRILLVSPKDNSHWWRKVKEVLVCVDKDLGFAESGIRCAEKSSAFLYVQEKQIVGLLIAECIDRAFKVIQEDTNSEGGKLICCSNEAERVCFGISRIWVVCSHRQKGIATRLVDAMRANMVSYHFLGVTDFAFSDPTQAGIHFAEKYTKRSDFLVYRRE